MPEQKILNTEVWCPVSGLKLKNNGMIPPHKMTLMVCVDGNLYAKCKLHLAKVFIQRKEFVKMILEASTVILIKQKRAKEGRNVAS